MLTHTLAWLAASFSILAPASASLSEPAATSGRIRVLILTGENNHDWRFTSTSLREMLVASGKFEVDIATRPAEALSDRERCGRYRAVVLDYNGTRWGEAAEANFIEAVRAGLGVVVVHAANNAFVGWKEYEELVGHLWRDGTGHGRFHAFDVKLSDRSHPITEGMQDLKAHPDELYHKLVQTPGTNHRVLATAWSDPETGGTGQDEPMITVASYGSGRVFHTPLGHVWSGKEASRASHRDPQFQELIVRGTEWAATGAVTPRLDVSSNGLTVAEREAGWRPLFDGQTSGGWRGFKQAGFPDKGWAIEEGCLKVKAKGGGGDIVTDETFGDFELELEWRVAEGANSGIMYRVSEKEDAVWRTGPEYQILDDSKHHDGGNPKTSAAALYGLIEAQDKLLRPVGEFNQARIVARGSQVEHWLNGVRVVSYDLASAEWKGMVADSKFASFKFFGQMPQGHIALQDHGDDVWYRNIKIRELPSGGSPLFNGKDLSGWTHFSPEGAAIEDVWSVEEGVLICKGQPIGYIKTEADYTNFVLDLDWRFNPVTKQAGNSGVLLRTQLPDKIWPKSVEAQLHSGNAGDFWCIGEFPMQADPKRTNGRNTKKLSFNENPIGEWNHYRIVVDHGNVLLEVNGKELNRATQVEEVPGKICLQSEGAEIHFRDIRLTPLP